MIERETVLHSLQQGEVFDLLVIGGGATGCGVALDAASRGLKVALAEKGDFGSGTSSRSTKLIHGGVRYLERALLDFDRVQFNLVRDALHERSILLRIAPHLSRPLPLITPLYRYRDFPYYLAGLELYDLLAGRMRLGRSRIVSREEVLKRFPGLRSEGLKGGVLYYDGQFNDARMNVALALTALEQGAAVANYLEVAALLKEEGRVVGAQVRDSLTGSAWEIRARAVVNASGPWCDLVRQLDDTNALPLLQVSSGIHILLPAGAAPAGTGLVIPRTEDGRVLFMLPWLGGSLVGTTDRPAAASDDPDLVEEDVEYLLRHLKRYFDLPLERKEIRAAWAGLRPLVRDPERSDTARLARDHVINCSPSGLITITGGKWTTYRKMALDTVDYAVRVAGLPAATPSHTEDLILCGGPGFRFDGGKFLTEEYGFDPDCAAHLQRNYGDRAEQVASLCEGALRERLAPGRPYLKGEVVYAVREELALTALDFLERRIPLALLDGRVAREAAPTVIELMARELSWDGERVRREMEQVERMVRAFGS